MTSAHQRLLLRSLNVPNADTIDLSRDSDLRQLVAWLEHKVIRQYHPDDRGPISDIKSERWPAAFDKYLHDLECPVEHTGTALRSHSVIDWLLHYAVDLMHGDKAKELVPLSMASSREYVIEAEKPTAQDITFSDVGQPEVKAAIDILLKQFGLENSDDSLPQKLASAKQILMQTIIPVVRDIELRQSKGAGSSAFLDMSSYPLGFSTGDEKTDFAAKILRMLYIKDLRTLQTQIDDMIVQIQEYTANPKIVAGLGVVGR